MAVVLFHGLIPLAAAGIVRIPSDVAYTLLARLPVCIFFALSGFVLARPFFVRPPNALAFICRRIARIYPPYLVATALAVLWLGRPPLFTLFETLLMTGTPSSVAINPPMWSLVVEMRFSLVFPLLWAVVARFPAAGAFAALAGTLVLLPLLPHVSPEAWRPTDGYSLGTSLAVSWYYAPLFVGGILLARIGERLWTIPSAHRAILWAVAAALVALGIRYDVAFLAAPLPIVALVPQAPLVVAFMRLRPVAWLGRVSYSLYLLHPVAMLCLWHAFGSPLVAATLFVPLAFLLAEGSYRWIERPSIAFGRRLAARIELAVGREARISQVRRLDDPIVCARRPKTVQSFDAAESSTESRFPKS